MPSEMATPPLPDLVLYSRPGCHLCDETRAVLQSLLEDRAASGRPIAHLHERNIDDDLTAHQAYSDKIPVIELKGRRIELATSPASLRQFLADGLDTLA
jgi:hypothetical protein